MSVFENSGFVVALRVAERAFDEVGFSLEMRLGD